MLKASKLSYVMYEAMSKVACITISKPQLQLAIQCSPMTPETLELVQTTSISNSFEELVDYTNPDGSIGGKISLGNQVAGIMATQIGEGVFIAEGACVLGDSIIGDDSVVYENVRVERMVTIGKSVVLATNSRIRSGATIGDKASIGEEAWVCRKANIPPEENISAGSLVL